MVNLDLLEWSLEELSSKEEQERLWIGQSDEISSFEEAVCVLFDDSGLNKAIDNGHRGEFSQEMIGSFKELQKLTSKMPANLSPDKVIDHPLMVEIRKMSAMLLDSVLAIRE